MKNGMKLVKLIALVIAALVVVGVAGATYGYFSRDEPTVITYDPGDGSTEIWIKNIDDIEIWGNELTSVMDHFHCTQEGAVWHVRQAVKTGEAKVYLFDAETGGKVVPKSFTVTCGDGLLLDLNACQTPEVGHEVSLLIEYNKDTYDKKIWANLPGLSTTEPIEPWPLKSIPRSIFGYTECWD
jgi:hypothetical protein